MKSSRLCASTASAAFRSKLVPLLALCALLITLVAGCASREVLIVTRANPACCVSTTNLYCLSSGQSASPGEVQLIPALRSHLRARGVELVPMPDADYSIACWMDVSHEHVSPYRGYPANSGPIIVGNGYGTSGSGGPPATSSREKITSTIRIRIYPTRLNDVRELAPAWDAYADAGIRVSEQRASNILKAMLEYWGQDFQGIAELGGDY